MIHCAPRGGPPPHPYSHHAVEAPPEVGRVRRGLLAIIGAIPLLFAISAMLDAQTPTTDSAARPLRRSWTSDRRDFSVGDIITIVIDEQTVASANTSTSAVDSKNRRMDAGASLPLPSAAGATGISNPTASVQSSNDAASNQTGDARRGTRFAGQMSVRVVSVTKEGNLQIRGSKLVDVDKNKQQMTLSGFIRPQDVSTRDVVDATRIADLQLVYAASGSLGKTRSGILTRILGVFWP